MFCNRCGTPVQPDYNLCPKCGQSLASQVVRPADPNRLERHIRTLGMLWIIAGALFLFPAVVCLILGSAAHFAIRGSELAAMLGPLVLDLIGGSFLFLAAGGILVGRGLIDRRPWARTVGLILGVLALFHPPFGTALGIYTLWVLLSNGADTQYQQMVRVA
jgi:hypothetical protein